MTSTARDNRALSGRLPVASRLLLFAFLALAEVLSASFLIGLPPRAETSPWGNPVLWANAIATVGITAVLLLVVIAYPRRREVRAVYAESEDAGRALYVVANLTLFAALIVAGTSLSAAIDPPLRVLVPYAGLLMATGASLAFVAAPPRFWVRLVRLLSVEIAVAVAGACVAVLGGHLLQSGWDSLAGATLSLSHWFLSLWEPNVVLQAEQKILGAGSFGVQVLPECSGLEGITLITAFLAAYTFMFRQTLRFPAALLLFPIGIGVIWLLNALRIAALVSIGAHVSPDVAVHGFHSQAGWISFLLVTLGLIATSQRIAFFSKLPQGSVATSPARPSGARVTLEYLAPFMALMAASIVAGAFAPHDHALYALKVAAVGGTLWLFRSAYMPLLSTVSPLSVAVGFAVGAAWIATDPAAGTDTATGVWLASLPMWLFALWLSVRFIGAVALVPLAEELAFRGYLSRALIASRFETVPVGQFSWVAFAGSSLAFGLVHQRWLAAIVAGAIYALLMYRTKRLSDPIAAHVASNAVITVWAVGAQQWSLL